MSMNKQLGPAWMDTAMLSLHEQHTCSEVDVPCMTLHPESAAHLSPMYIHDTYDAPAHRMVFICSFVFVTKWQRLQRRLTVAAPEAVEGGPPVVQIIHLGLAGPKGQQVQKNTRGACTGTTEAVCVSVCMCACICWSLGRVRQRQA